MDTDKNDNFEALLDANRRFASFGEINPIKEKIIGCSYIVSNNWTQINTDKFTFLFFYLCLSVSICG